MYLPVIIIIIAIVVIFFVGQAAGKMNRDIDLMNKLGVTDSKDQQRIINKYGRGNVTEINVMKYFMEKMENEDFD